MFYVFALITHIMMIDTESLPVFSHIMMFNKGYILCTFITVFNMHLIVCMFVQFDGQINDQYPQLPLTWLGSLTVKQQHQTPMLIS